MANRKYECTWCNSVYNIEEIGGNDTDIIYCPNCGHDTLNRTYIRGY